MSYFFDPREIDREPAIEVVADGVYVSKIAKVQKKEDNFGLKLKVYYEIVDENRKKMVMENFNLGHGSPKVEEIGKKTFVKLLDALGIGDAPLQSETDLVGKKVKLDLTVEPHYRDPSQSQNRIKRHLPLTILDTKKGTGDDVPF